MKRHHLAGVASVRGKIPNLEAAINISQYGNLEFKH
jgi:hypothetical protein